jgi:hypothetical protein
MTEPVKKLDGGKPRMDLIPYPDLHIIDIAVPVDTMYEALQLWFYGAPFALTMPIPRNELVGVATVLGFGAAKYAPRGWEKGIEFSRVFSAAARHAEAWARGELLDPESGYPHAWHFWCNVVFIVTFTSRGRTDLDDRPPAHPSVRSQIDGMTTLRAQIDGIMSPGPNPAKPNGIN